MSAIFPIQGSFEVIFNPDQMLFSQSEFKLTGYAIGTTSQSVILPDGKSQVHACFVVQSRNPEGKLIHWIVPVIKFEVDRQDNKGTIYW